MDFGALRKGRRRVGHGADVGNVAEEGEENAIEKQLAALIDGPSLYCAVTPIVGRREAGFERSFRRRGNIEAEP